MYTNALYQMNRIAIFGNKIQIFKSDTPNVHIERSGKLESSILLSEFF